MPSFIKNALIYLAVAAVCWVLMCLFLFLFGAIERAMEKTKSTVQHNLLLPIHDLFQFLFLFFSWMRFLILPMMFFGWNDHIITWYCTVAVIGLFVYSTIGAGEFWIVNSKVYTPKWYGVALQGIVTFLLLNYPIYYVVGTMITVQYGNEGWPILVCVSIAVALNLFLIVYYSIQFYRLYQLKNT